jgi:Na+/proline symporter
VIGSLVIIYTVSGGTKAVSQTQKLQMLVILIGMGVAFYLLVQYLPDNVSFKDALYVAGASGKLNAVDFSLDFNNRYTFWSGITGGLFLMMAYFGTDQSQVQRYLTGHSIRESRLGLLFNAALKVPMQFFILLTGIMVFLFYQFHQAPVFFNQVALDEVRQSEQYEEFQELQDTYDEWFTGKQELNMAFLAARDAGQMKEASAIAADIKIADQRETEIRNAVKSVIAEVNPEAETNDTDYVFISFILDYIPRGLIGLLLAVIFSAAMSSTAAELNALGSTTVVDFYRRSIRKTASEKHYVNASMGFTLMWGVIAILFAIFGTLFENLIQFVNIVGSLFYGTILGIFLIAFFLKKVGGHAVFIAALIAECLVFYAFLYTDIGYLWYNVIGCGTVMILSVIIEVFTGPKRNTPTSV